MILKGKKRAIVYLLIVSLLLSLIPTIPGKAEGEACQHDLSILRDDSLGHWYECSRCDNSTVSITKEGHTPSTNTNYSESICTVCGRVIGAEGNYTHSIIGEMYHLNEFEDEVTHEPVSVYEYNINYWLMMMSILLIL